MAQQLCASDDVVPAVAPEESPQSAPNDDEQRPAVEPCPRCGSALIPRRHQNEAQLVASDLLVGSTGMESTLVTAEKARTFFENRLP